MCGIIGITTSIKNSAIGAQIYDALSRLEYRGYDSVGIAVVGNNEITIRKDRGAIKEVGERLDFQKLIGETAIGHSRWATHGPPSQINAHPHKSMDGKITVVHNGIIENFLEIRKELTCQGYKFISQTDTELIPHFLSNEIKKGKSMLEAIYSLTDRIIGTFAIVITYLEEPNTIYALKKDNPLVLGITEKTKYCASDIPAFLPWTKEVINLRDFEMAILKPDSYQIINLADKSKITRKSHRVTWTTEAAQRGGYPHHMLKEIHEQPKIINTQLATQSDNLDEISNLILNCEKIIPVAAGTAHYASLNILHLFPKYIKKIVIPCIASEWDDISPIVDSKTLIIAVSQSGETLDTIKAVKDGIEKGAKLLSIVNVTGSTLTTYSDEVFYIHAGPEIGVAATKTFTAQVLAIWRILLAILKRDDCPVQVPKEDISEFETSLKNLSETVRIIIQRSEAKARDLAEWLKDKNSMFYLGRGISFITSLEGALKIKEISSIHAEAFPAGESKHGPIALVKDDYPIVFAIPNDETRKKMMGSVQEMTARGATTLGIIEEGDEEMKQTLKHFIEIPKGYSKFLSTIAYQIPQQFLAYYTSVKRGFNPDKPTNLAKSVTVE